MPGHTPVGAEDDRVDRPDRPRVGGEFVQQWDHRLLTGMSDVASGTAEALGRRQQFGEGGGGEIEGFDVDQAVLVREALGAPFDLVQCR